HARQVPVQHRRWFHQGFPQGHHGEFHRKSPRLVDSILNRLGQFPEVGVTGRQFRPGIADSNDGFPGKFMTGNALVFHPCAVYKSVFSFFSKPLLATEFLRHIVAIKIVNSWRYKEARAARRSRSRSGKRTTSRMVMAWSSTAGNSSSPVKRSVAGILKGCCRLAFSALAGYLPFMKKTLILQWGLGMSAIILIVALI